MTNGNIQTTQKPSWGDSLLANFRQSEHQKGRVVSKKQSTYNYTQKRGKEVSLIKMTSTPKLVSKKKKIRHFTCFLKEKLLLILGWYEETL